MICLYKTKSYNVLRNVIRLSFMPLGLSKCIRLIRWKMSHKLFAGGSKFANCVNTLILSNYKRYRLVLNKVSRNLMPYINFKTFSNFYSTIWFLMKIFIEKNLDRIWFYDLIWYSNVFWNLPFSKSRFKLSNPIYNF